MMNHLLVTCKRYCTEGRLERGHGRKAGKEGTEEMHERGHGRGHGKEGTEGMVQKKVRALGFGFKYAPKDVPACPLKLTFWNK